MKGRGVYCQLKVELGVLAGLGEKSDSFVGH